MSTFDSAQPAYGYTQNHYAEPSATTYQDEGLQHPYDSKKDYGELYANQYPQGAAEQVYNPPKPNQQVEYQQSQVQQQQYQPQIQYQQAISQQQYNTQLQYQQPAVHQQYQTQQVQYEIAVVQQQLPPPPPPATVQFEQTAPQQQYQQQLQYQQTVVQQTYDPRVQYQQTTIQQYNPQVGHEQVSIQQQYQPQTQYPQAAAQQNYQQQTNVTLPPPPPPPAYSPVNPATYGHVASPGYYPVANGTDVIPTLPQRPQSYIGQAHTFQNGAGFPPPPPPPQSAVPETKKSIGLKMLKNFGKELSSASKQTYQQAKQEFSTRSARPGAQTGGVSRPQEPTNTTIAQSTSDQPTREQSVATQGDTPPIARKPVGQQIGALGARAMNAANSENAKKMLLTAASALNFVSSVADPTDPNTIALKMLNSAVQTGVQKSKAKQDVQETTSEVPEETGREVNSGTDIGANNPLANMTPEQLAMIVALASQLQGQQAQGIAGNQQVQVPDLSKLTIEDPPEASLDDLVPQPLALNHTAVKDALPHPIAPTPINTLKPNSETPGILHVNPSISSPYAKPPNDIDNTARSGTPNVAAPIQQKQPYENKAEDSGIGSWADFFSEACKAYYTVQVAQAAATTSDESLFSSILGATGVAQDDNNTADASLGITGQVAPFPVTDLVRSMAHEYAYRKSGSGWYESNDYSLRADGTFAFDLGSGFSVESYNKLAWASGYDQKRPTGYWKAEGTTTEGTFTFKHANGDLETRDYWENNQGHFIVNGIRWFRP